MLGLVLGVALAVLPGKPRLLLVALLGFFRAIPVLMLIFWTYFLLPIVFHVDVPALATVVCALSLIGGAYLAHSVYAGIHSLPAGQWAAARALGLRPWQVLRLVILPQALPVMLPSFLNQWVSLIKDTSLAYVIGVGELSFVATQVSNRVMVHPTEIFLFVALLYFLLCTSLDLAAAFLARRRRLSGGRWLRRRRAPARSRPGRRGNAARRAGRHRPSRRARPAPTPPWPTSPRRRGRSGGGSSSAPWGKLEELPVLALQVRRQRLGVAAVRLFEERPQLPERPWMEGFLAGGSQAEGGRADIVEQAVGIELQDLLDQRRDELLGIEQHAHGEQLQRERILACARRQGRRRLEVDLALLAQAVAGGAEQPAVVQPQRGGLQVDGAQFGAGQAPVDGLEQQRTGVFRGLAPGPGVFQGCVPLRGERLAIAVAPGKPVERGDQFAPVGFPVGEVDVPSRRPVSAGQVAP